MNNAGSAEGAIINNGRYDDLDISDQGSNTIKLICKGNQGWLYINANFVAELALSARVNSGTLSVATGIYAGHQIDDKTTRFVDFKVWSIQ
jgi:hypothetical protein